LTEEFLITIGNEIFQVISRKDRKDLQASWFSTSPSRIQMLERLASFHDETAQKNRMKIVSDRQKDSPEMFSARKLLHGWNLTSGRKIKAPGEDGGSTTCAITIDVKSWQDLHNEFCTELKSTPKQFVSLVSLANVRKLILMDIFYLRGCDVFKKLPSTSHPPRSSPRGAARAPNQNGHRGDDDDHDASADSGSRRAGAAARRRLEAPAAAVDAAADDAADCGGPDAAADQEGGGGASADEGSGGASAAEEEGAAAAAENEGGGGEGEGGVDLDWTRWNPDPPWPAVFSTLRVPRTRDFACLPAAQALAIMFFFRDDLRKKFPALNNDIFQGWQASYGRCISAEGLKLLPVVGPAAMNDAQQTWCRETIRFYEESLNDEQRVKLGLKPRKTRRSRDPAPEAAEVSGDELDARLRKKVAAGKEVKPHRKTLADAAPSPPTKAAASPPTEAAARAPTKQARAGKRVREIESIAQEFLQDDGPRVSSCKSLSIISHLCYAYIKYYLFCLF
jgi:hypothetical protein